MGLFGKNSKNNETGEVDEKKVNAFIDWFLSHSDMITSSMINRMQDRKTMKSVMEEVEDQLAIVYRDGYKGKIEFDYCDVLGRWELTLYHYNKPFLMKATEMIAEGINSMKLSKWTVNTRK